MEVTPVQTKVLSENDRLAAILRERYSAAGVLCLNLISSPGAGKTTLLERTLAQLPVGTKAAVLTGDIQTDCDASRLQRFGHPVKQITTGGTCHLDARMIDKHLEGWNLAELDYLFIENVGNLVCPASYDLGEEAKVVILSTAEGEEKPLKYPSIFFKSALMILNKSDLVPYVGFDVNLAKENARKVHPNMEIIETSCRTGNGIASWLDWISARREAYLSQAPAAK